MERGSAWMKWAGYGCLVLALSGCGGGSETPATSGGPAAGGEATASTSMVPPESVVQEFLEAVRTGNAEQSASLLTETARTETAKLELAVAPPGSETASYTVGKVEMVGSDIAHVASTWTDLGDDGQPNSDNIIWVLRSESGAWRIGGMATTVFPGEPPLLLDFENPQDMLRKQQLVEEEYMRRAGLNPDGTPITGDAVAAQTGGAAPSGEQQPAAQQVQVPGSGEAIQR